MGRKYQRMDRPGVCQVPEGSGEQRKMEQSGCEVIISQVIIPQVMFFLAYLYSVGTQHGNLHPAR